MSNRKLDETLEELGFTTGDNIREEVISKSMKNLKERLSGLDIQIEKQEKEVVKEELKPHYEGTELADTALSVYRDNIKSRDRADKIDAVQKKDPADKANTPSTIASRANVRALSRSLAGMRSSGNEGKTSPKGPNGIGNVGKLSPTGDDGVGNMSNNSGTYYALTTDMTLEEYEQYVQSIFEGDDCGCEHEKSEKTKKEIKARGGPPGYPDKSKVSEGKEEDRKDAMPKGDVGYEIHKKAVQQYNKQNPSKKVKEDVVHELEQRLVTLGSTDWIVVDQVLREMARDLDVAPITLSREFRSVHGVYPDKWIKEHLDLEVCGFMPLEEAVRLNKVGKVYEVTFMFRGGTNRLKFFWPHPGDASKEDMQREVEKFWPKGRVLAFYPTIDNEQTSNYMVMASPMTENYRLMEAEDWVEMNEEENEIYNMICEEEGEPLSPPLIEDDGTISVIIEDYDDGEEREVLFSEKRGLWDNIHAKRKRGESPAKKGDKDYPETLNVESLEQARKNVGASTCWDGYKAKGTKKKDGKDVPNCVKEDDYESKKKQEVIGALNKKKSGFTKRYGKDAPDVMYAVAAKTAKRKGDTSKSDDRYAYEEVEYVLEGKSKKRAPWNDSYTKTNRENSVSGNRDYAITQSDEKKERRADRRKNKPAHKYDTNEEFIPEGDEMKGMSQKSGDKRSTESGAGMTAKGVAKYNARTGGNLKTAVTTPPSKLKAGSKAAGRRKSFCARSKSWDGERGKAARRRWNC